jgi:histidinol-phosphate aminotransferase
MRAYVPGEQPKIAGLIKLNTNENPYPPSPKVLKAVRQAVDARLRLYPNPTAQPLREALAKFHTCAPENILVGNGSDECLAMAVRAFVEPGAAVQFFTPSYSLYPVLAAAHGADSNAVPLPRDFSLPTVQALKQGRQWQFDAPLTFITTPNAPSGRGYARRALAALSRAQQGVVVLDEAYVDFADEHALPLALKHSHVLVARTFSKAYSLCSLRVGYFVGHVELIAALDTIRDSYNVNGLGQIAAVATMSDLPYYRTCFRKVIRTRQRLTRALTALDFEVLPSQTNFLFVRPPRHTAETWQRQLRERRVLVRWFSGGDVRDYLRITIGTDREAGALVEAVRQVLGVTRPSRLHST